MWFGLYCICIVFVLYCIEDNDLSRSTSRGYIISTDEFNVTWFTIFILKLVLDFRITSMMLSRLSNNSIKGQNSISFLESVPLISFGLSLCPSTDGFGSGWSFGRVLSSDAS